MCFKEFMEMNECTNAAMTVTDSNYSTIVAGSIFHIITNRTDLHNMEVLHFGYYDGMLVVRLKANER